MKRIDLFCQQLEGFLERFHADGTDRGAELRGRFASRAGGGVDLYGCADAVFVLWITGELEPRTTPEGRHEWASLLRSFQDPGSGWFERGDRLGHSKAHATGFATAALRLLGEEPAYRFSWAPTRFGRPEAVDAWLDALDWTIVWRGSHEAGAAAALIDAPEGADLPASWSTWLLDGLTRRIDPATGFWKRGWFDRFWSRPTPIDLGGAAHFWWLFDRLGRPIPRPANALASILQLQRRSGIWGSRLFNGNYPQGIDFDAMNGMRLAWQALSPAARERFRPQILASLQGYADAVDGYLCRPRSAERLFTTTHKIVGALNAIAETNLLAIELTGEPVLHTTPRPWNCALEEVSWQ